MYIYCITIYLDIYIYVCIYEIAYVDFLSASEFTQFSSVRIITKLHPI